MSDVRVRSAHVKTELGKLNRPVVKLAPLFRESVFREENKAGDVAVIHLQNEKSRLQNLNGTNETYNSKLRKFRRKIKEKPRGPFWKLTKTPVPEKGMSQRLFVIEA